MCKIGTAISKEKYIERVLNTIKNENLPYEYRPISMWGYFGYQILFALPCVGLILLLVFSFGGTKNKNLKNFARSYFCVLIIAVVLVAIIMAVGGVGFLSSVSNGYY